MNRALRAKIKEKAGNCCKICTHWCYEKGSPHHVVKQSEESLLKNCETNVWWLCESCHTRTENEPGYNHQLQLELKDYYQTLFSVNKYYNLKDISMIVNMPLKDLGRRVIKEC